MRHSSARLLMFYKARKTFLLCAKQPTRCNGLPAAGDFFLLWSVFLLFRNMFFFRNPSKKKRLPRALASPSCLSFAPSSIISHPPPPPQPLRSLLSSSPHLTPAPHPLSHPGPLPPRHPGHPGPPSPGPPLKILLSPGPPLPGWPGCHPGRIQH